MATQTNNFTRSNVNAATLQITDPGRSSFNLGHKNELSIPFGKIVPVSTKILLPTDTFTGSLKPNFHLEKIGTPSIGATRLDTHTFVVNFRRINKDLRKNLETGVNFFPSINIYNVLDKNVAFLFGDTSLFSLLTANFNAHSNFYDVSINALQSSIGTIKTIFDSYHSFGEYCYQYDKYVYLDSYYKDVLNNLKNLTLDHKDPRIFFQYFLPSLFKPFIGPSSLLDYLGYPCYSSYNKIVLLLNDRINAVNQIPLDFDAFFSSFKDYFTKHATVIQEILSNSLSFSFSLSGAVVWSAEAFQKVYSELPIRAYYSVWYDYLRNWHIEERSNILDPDNFSNLPIIKSVSSEELNSDNLHRMNEFLSLCTLRSRDYGTDFLTSIQSDDAFRHVYSPVFNTDSTKYSYSGTSLGGDVDPKSINGFEIQRFGLFDFPSDSVGEKTSINFDYAQDLQTMRRSGMLEKWLARNYYYPDTYVGRLQARFGVRPSDYEVLVSQYIGGSESFISGQELVANMSTSESVVGSRNFKADVSTTDNFSGSVSDYSILISVVSTVPIVTYDVVSPAARITDFVDFPQPEFATDARVEARVSDFLRGFSIKPFIGYVPRYYMFRVSADESHGRYLTDYRSYNWLRDNYSMSQENFDFSLNPYSLRVNLPLNAFIGLKEWDDFAYGSCDVNLVVNRALPAAIEII